MCTCPLRAGCVYVLLNKTVNIVHTSRLVVLGHILTDTIYLLNTICRYQNGARISKIYPSLA